MNQKIRKLVYRVVILVIITGILGFSYSYYEGTKINVTSSTFTHKDIPPSFDGKKIIYLSDMHCNRFFTPQDMEKLVVRVNNLQPDIILLGGDNTDKDSIYSTPYFNEVTKLQSRYGVYSVLGNHDHWEDATLIQAGLQAANVNICDNHSYWIREGNDSIKIGGVGDLWEDSQDIEQTIYDVKEKDFCILLSHNPDYIELIDNNLADLIIAGHNHGGQVTLFGWYAPIMPSLWRPHQPDTGQKYRYGWKKRNNIQMYVSTGIGVGEFPFRFFAPPEIVEITLKRED